MTSYRTAQNLSANTLFHFTKRSNFFSIMDSGSISPQYSIEVDPFKPSNIKYATPMACFCDIPLSFIKKHIKAYGMFGVGLSKKWGIKHKIDPVLYFHDNSFTTSIIHDTLAALFEQKTESSKYLFYKLQQISLFSKRYEGPNRNGKLCRFYDEREWRFVPSHDILELLEIHSILVHENIEKKLLNQFNAILRQAIQLQFKPIDINYLIVSSESQIPRLHKLVKSNWPDQVGRILPKILTAAQIFEDF